MGVASDQEIVQLVGQELSIVSYIVPTLHECKELGVFSQMQALEYIGSKMRSKTSFGMKEKRPKEDEARDALANLLLHHVPHHKYNFQRRLTYIGYVLRR